FGGGWRRRGGGALGAKAEPREPRHPSALAAGLATLVSGISSLVASSIAVAVGPHHHHPHASHTVTGAAAAADDDDDLAAAVFGADDDDSDAPRPVRCARFAFVDWVADAPGWPRRTRVGPRAKRCIAPAGRDRLTIQLTPPSSRRELDPRQLRDFRLCLLLGYSDGFQIWDVTDTDDVREVCSVRDAAFAVADLEAIPYSWSTLHKEDDHGPLLCFMFYSMVSHRVVADVQVDGEAREVRASERFVVVSTLLGALHVFSAVDFRPVVVISDTQPPVSGGGPVFDVGARLLAYASSSPPPSPLPRGARRRRRSAAAATSAAAGVSGASGPRRPRDDDSSSTDDAGDFGDHDGGSARDGLTGADAAALGKNIGKAAAVVAKELYGGVRAVGGYGYSALSSYFHGASATPGDVGGAGAGPPPPAALNGTPAQTRERKAGVDGVVVIIDLCELAESASASSSGARAGDRARPLCHWKPHSNAVQALAFNPQQTMLFSASTLGTTFHIYAMPPPRAFAALSSTSAASSTTAAAAAAPPPSRRRPRRIYYLERGLTAARVESVSFSLPGDLIAVATAAKGTAHLYRLDPAAAVNPPVPAAAAYELGVLNGWADSVPRFDPLARAAAAAAAAGGWAAFPGAAAGPITANVAAPTARVAAVYPVARIRQNLAIDLALASETASSSADDDAYATPRANSAAQNPLPVPPPRARLCLAFLVDPTDASGTVPAKLNAAAAAAAAAASTAGAFSTSPGAAAVSAAGTRLSRSPHFGGGGVGGGSWGAASTSGGTGAGAAAAGGSSLAHRQRVLAFHPAGVLQLHHVDFGMVLGGSGGSLIGGTAPAASTSGMSPRSPSSAGTVRPRVSPRELGHNTAGAGGAPMAAAASAAAVRVSVREAVEWDVARSRGLPACACPVRPTTALRAPAAAWASQVELATYDPVAVGPPFWNAPIAFHTFAAAATTATGNTAPTPPPVGHPDLTDLPPYGRVVVARAVAMPYSAPAASGSAGKTSELLFPVARGGGRHSAATSSTTATYAAAGGFESDLSSAMVDALDPAGAVAIPAVRVGAVVKGAGAIKLLPCFLLSI
ncbi:hypothetical protein HK405_006784, partial [Cladochytrium tenue]